MEHIGFIGLGAMGKPMARNLMKAGYALNLLTRTRTKVEDLLREGGTWYSTPKEIAQQSNVVITMLPDTPDVVQVVAGKDGVLEGARPGTLIIDMSTISPVAARKLARDAQARAHWTPWPPRRTKTGSRSTSTGTLRRPASPSSSAPSSAVSTNCAAMTRL